jgi:hypothetical protein
MGRPSTWGQGDRSPARALSDHILSGTRALELAPAAIRTLPVETVDTMSEGGPILAVAPRPDDDTLRRGGLPVLVRAAVRPVGCGIDRDGAAPHAGAVASPPRRLATSRVPTMRTAPTTHGRGAHHRHTPGLHDGTLARDGTAVRWVMKRFTAYRRRCRTKAICTTWPHDPPSVDQAAPCLCKTAAACSIAGVCAYSTGSRLLPPERWVFVSRVGSFRVHTTAVPSAKRAATKPHTIETGMMTGRACGFVLADVLLQKLSSGHEACLQCA